jgi:hypothetical protein
MDRDLRDRLVMAGARHRVTQLVTELQEIIDGIPEYRKDALGLVRAKLGIGSGPKPNQAKMLAALDGARAARENNGTPPTPAPKPKRVLSPETRAKLAANLERARAALGKKQRQQKKQQKRDKPHFSKEARKKISDAVKARHAREKAAKVAAKAPVAAAA